jgi:hypothetical protein
MSYVVISWMLAMRLVLQEAGRAQREALSQARNWSLDKLLAVAEEFRERAWEGQGTLGELVDISLGE